MWGGDASSAQIPATGADQPTLQPGEAVIYEFQRPSPDHLAVAAPQSDTAGASFPSP